MSLHESDDALRTWYSQQERLRDALEAGREALQRSQDAIAIAEELLIKCEESEARYQQERVWRFATERSP